MPLASFTLAQEPTKHYSPEQKQAVKHWALWTAGMILGAMLITGIVLVILDRQRRTIIKATEAKRRRTRHSKDAWAEAGKRIDPDAAGAKDDTVDIDPGDIGPHDVDGENGRDPHGEGPHG